MNTIIDNLVAEFNNSVCLEESDVRELVGLLLAERAELKRDAERYRHIVKWLSHYGASGHRGVCMPSDYSSSTKAECDTSIDAAKQATK
jgi:hypothetical protein